MLSFLIQLYYTVARDHGIDLTEPDKVGYVNQYGLSRKVSYSDDPAFTLLDLIKLLLYQHIFESVKHSLERLQLDYVDVLQCLCSRAAASCTPPHARGFRPSFR